MEAKIKHIKKKDLNVAPSPVEEVANVDPRDVVKSWIKEFQEDHRDQTLETFDSLFSDSRP